MRSIPLPHRTKAFSHSPDLDAFLVGSTGVALSAPRPAEGHLDRIA